jgi:hypothetical protein
MIEEEKIVWIILVHALTCCVAIVNYCKPCARMLTVQYLNQFILLIWLLGVPLRVFRCPNQRRNGEKTHPFI